MWRRWTKTDKTLFLVYAGVIAGFAHLNNAYQGCISFQPFLILAFVLLFAGGILIKNLGARKSVVAGLGAAFLLECAAIYAVLPADTYAEGWKKMEERWLGGYGNVELMAETKNYVGYFTGYETESTARRFVNKITGRSDEPVIRRRPYVYIFGADKDIIACIYDPFDGRSRIGTLKNVRNTDWQKLLVMGGYGWEEDDGQGGL